MRTLALSFLLAVGSLTAADLPSIDVHGVNVIVPPPLGFSRVTPDMKKVDALQHQVTAPMNELLAGYIPTPLVPAALSNQAIALLRSCTIQTEKRLGQARLTPAQFARIKQSLTDENEALMKNVEKQMPGLLKKLSHGLTKELGSQITVSMPAMVPYPPHDDSERVLSFSMLVRYQLDEAGAASQTMIATVTGTFVLVRGKILYLYCNGAAEDLDWGRGISKQWSQALLAANPGEAPGSDSFLSGDSTGKRILRNTLIGALIGAVVGLLRYWLKGRKPKIGS